MGDDDVFEAEEFFFVEAFDLLGMFAEEVAAEEDVSDEASLGGVFGSGRFAVEFDDFSDIVKDGAGEDEVDVEGGIEVGEHG